MGPFSRAMCVQTVSRARSTRCPRPGILVRITGQAPLQAKVYELQKLRCNLCGKVFTAEAARRQ